MTHSLPTSPIGQHPPSLPPSVPSVPEDPRALITYCDDANIWPTIEKPFLLRLPLQKLPWKSIRGTKLIDSLNVRLKSFHESIVPRYALYSSVAPILHLYFLNVEDTEQYRTTTRQKIKDWLALFTNRRDHEWLIVYVGAADSKPKFLNIKASVLDKLKSDFQKDKKERVFLLRLLDPDANDQELWGEFLNRIKEGILHSFESQVARYEEDIQRLDAQRLVPGWNFCQFFLLKEGLANCFASISLLEEAGIQYEELEATHYQTINSQISSFRTFGGNEPGDDAIAYSLFSKSPPKDFRSLMLSNKISIFDFRNHLIRQQLQLLQQQNQPLNLLRRSLSFLSLFQLLMIEYESVLPIWFRQSYILCFVDSVLAQCDLMLPFVKGATKEVMPMIQSTRLDLILLACAQLDDIGSKVYPSHLHTESDGIRSSTTTTDHLYQEIHDSIKNDTCIKALSNFDSYAEILLGYLIEGEITSKLCRKTKIELRLKKKLADISFAREQWDDSSTLYKDIAQNYSDSGWLSIDRSLLHRLAVCYQNLNHTRAYIITCLQLMASMISQMEFSSLEAMALDLNEMKLQSEQLSSPAALKFSPLFQSILPNVLHSVQQDEYMALTQVSIKSFLPTPFLIDKVAISLVGGETSDVIFFQKNVLLQPGENSLRMLWENPSTSGQYVAEKMVIEAGKLTFVQNLIKENKKHTLQIHEPLGPLSLSLSLPECILPKHSRIMLLVSSDDAHLVVENGQLSIRIITPDTQVEAVKMIFPDGSTSEPLEIKQTKFQLPNVVGSIRLLICIGTSSSAVSLKVVLEYVSSNFIRTVSVTESVAFMPLPVVETEFQVVQNATFLLLSMTNPFDSPLCIDDYDLQLEDGEAKCIQRAPATLMPNQTLTTCYQITRIPSEGHLNGKVSVHHHYRKEDVFKYIQLQLKDELQKLGLAMYFSPVWSIIQRHLEETTFDDLILSGQQSLPPLQSAAWSELTHISYDISAQLQMAANLLLGRLQPLRLEILGQYLVPSRMAEYLLAAQVPAHHLEYQWKVRETHRIMIGHPVFCSLHIRHRNALWVRQASDPEALLLHYDLDLSCEIWLSIGPKRHEFSIKVIYCDRGKKRTLPLNPLLRPEESISFDLFLVPVVSGALPLPPVQFYPMLESQRRASPSPSRGSSIQSLTSLLRHSPTARSAPGFSTALVGDLPTTLTVQPELVSTVVVVGHQVIGIQRKSLLSSNFSLLSATTAEHRHSTMDMRRSSNFSLS